MQILTILISLVLNIIYYVFAQKLKIKNFVKYFVGFLIYSLILLILFLLFKIYVNFETFIFFIALYILFFISLFLTVSTKHIKSPTYLIFKSLKRKNTKKKIIIFLKKQKVIELRIKDLKNQNIIKIKKNKIILTNNLGIIFGFFLFIKKFFNLKARG